ncbi:MAG: lytic transglycosylase domain-containing protein [Candidatus Accumulibacter sp.]|jgi:type IV secretion system protein VirB1|nr:lytic transglycosylase domain-containing protein [Accumulibacter sp.]
MFDFLALAQECAPAVAPETMAAVVRVESGYRPLAIGVVNGRLARQPASLEEAVATALALERDGWNFSLGLAQVNRHNLARHGLSYRDAFDACANLRAGSLILADCYRRARASAADDQAALQAALSCYYSGNFKTGFRTEGGKPSYVQKVYAGAGEAPPPIPVVPAPGRATPAKPPPPAGGPEESPARLRPAPSRDDKKDESTQKDESAGNPAIVF